MTRDRPVLSPLNVTVCLLALVTVAAVIFLTSPPPGMTPSGARPWSEGSWLKALTDALALNFALPTPLGFEIKDLAAGVMAAANLPSNEVFDPAAGRAITPLAGANLRCTITNTAIPGANITLQKALGGTGRVVASDQFALSIKGSSTPVSVNTTGTGTAITSAANTVTATPGTAYTLDEAMATGSGSSLSAYTRSVTCSNTGPTSVFRSSGSTYPRAWISAYAHAARVSAITPRGLTPTRTCGWLRVAAASRTAYV